MESQELAQKAEALEPDYLAICWIGAGSSYVRHKDKYQAVVLLRERIVSDWGSVFDIHGKEVEFGIFDVSGHESLWWDYNVHDKDTDETIPMLETAKVMLPVKQPDVESMTKEEVVAAYNNLDDPIGYERALGRLMVLGLSERQADSLLV